MFSIIPNFKNRTIIGEISLLQFIADLKHPSIVHKGLVDTARKAGKSKNRELYDSIKSTIPCIAFNFNYFKKVDTEGIVSPSGYLYIDVDKKISKDFSNKEYVVACWESLSQEGIGILVSVNGVNKTNLKDAILEISEDLGIDSDIHAISVDRLTVLSCDDSPYVNLNYKEYLYKDKIYHSSVTTNILYNRLQANCDFFDSEKLRTSDYLEKTESIDFNGELYITLEEAIDYTEIYLPPNIKEGKRNGSLYAATSNCRGLNPNATKARISGFIANLNDTCCNPPLPFEEVAQIVDNVFLKEPILHTNKRKRIIFNPDYNLSGSKRQSISATVTAEEKRKSTLRSILMALDEWDYKEQGRVTNKKIAQKIGKHQNTITNYSKEIKEFLACSE